MKFPKIQQCMLGKKKGKECLCQLSFDTPVSVQVDTSLNLLKKQLFVEFGKLLVKYFS